MKKKMEKIPFNWKEFGICVSFSLIIHVVTWILGSLLTICTPCFYMHLIPFANGFFGEPAILTWIYYAIQISVLALIVRLIRSVIRRILQKGEN